MNRMALAKALLIILGAGAIVAAAIYTLGHMTDRTVFTVLVPAAVVGLMLIVVGVRIESPGPARARRNE